MDVIRPLSSSQRNRLQDQAAAVMFSAGRVLSWTATGTDAHGRPTGTWTAGATIAAGIAEPTRREAEDTVPITDWIARLPHGTAVSAADRFRITSLWGTTVSIDCEIVGEVHQGQAAVVLKLARLNSQ